MRLIDADAAIHALSVASRGDSKDVIRNLVIRFLLAMPTGEAIPVEWIKKFAEESKRHIQESVNNYTYMYDYMLSEWKQRKEE